METFGIKVHGRANGPAAQRQHQTLHGGHISSDFGSDFARIVGAPDGGAQRDHACPCNARQRGQNAKCPQTPALLWHKRDGRHAHRSHGLQRGDVRHFRFSLRVRGPNKTCQVCNVGRGGDQCHRQIEFGWTNAFNAAECFLHHHAKSSTFNSAKKKWQERPT